MTSTAEAVAFWILGSTAVLSALGLLFARKAVHAALGVAVTMAILGIFYIAQGAPFLGIVQIFVYAGAVMMLFLFVVMLVGVDSSDSLIETIRGQRWMALLLASGLAVLLAGMIGKVTIGGEPSLDGVNATGNISAMAEVIFGKYVWVFPLEVTVLAFSTRWVIQITQHTSSLALQFIFSTGPPDSPRFVPGILTGPAAPRCAFAVPAMPMIAKTKKSFFIVVWFLRHPLLGGATNLWTTCAKPLRQLRNFSGEPGYFRPNQMDHGRYVLDR